MTVLRDAETIYIGNTEAARVYIGSREVWSPGIAFSSVWDTRNTEQNFSGELISTEENQISLPLVENGNYNFIVSWGDGNFDQITSFDQPEKTHTYDEPGRYTINIQGDILGWSFNNSGDKNKIIEIRSFGELSLGLTEGQFFGCENLTITADDSVSLESTTSLKNVFRDCKTLSSAPSLEFWNTNSITNLDFAFANATNFNQYIGSWNTTNVESMRFTFYQANSFNKDISSWDTSSVKDMGYLFDDATSFNQDISSWQTTLVTDMNSMFAGATNFNHPLNWDTQNVVDMSNMFGKAKNFNQDISFWNTGNVSDMNSMFYEAESFNQPLNSWDVTNVQNMSFMFSEAKNFDQPLSGWITNSLRDTSYMFYNANSFSQDLSTWDIFSLQKAKKMFTRVTLETSDYDALLAGWSSTPINDIPENIEIDFGFSKYTNQAAKDILLSKGWTIIDGGLDE